MNLIGILIASVLLVGGMLHLIRIHLSKRKLEKRIYRMSLIDLITKLYISVPFLVFMILFTGLLVQKIFMESIFYSFALIIPIILGFLSIPSLLLLNQYFKIEKDRLIELDLDNRQLSVQKKGKENIISNSDIKLVEYYPTTPAKEPYDFEYLVVTLNDGSKFILTNLYANLSDFEPVFRGAKRKYNKRRIFNKINWG